MSNRSLSTASSELASPNEGFWFEHAITQSFLDPNLAENFHRVWHHLNPCTYPLEAVCLFV